MNPKSEILIIFLIVSAILNLAFCREFGIVTLKKLADVRESSSSEIDSIARFAVQEHNKQSNTVLEFGRVLKAKEQVVAGKIYHLTLETFDSGKNTIYEAKVWVKPWMNFKQLQEFKRVSDAYHLTISNLTRERLGWHKVPIHDPEIREAANNAVRTLNNMSNCLCQYQLLEILQAKTEVIKDFVKYNLLLKLKWGTKDETFRFKLQKTASGNYILDHFEQ